MGIEPTQDASAAPRKRFEVRGPLFADVRHRLCKFDQAGRPAEVRCRPQSCAGLAVILAVRSRTGGGHVGRAIP